MTVCAPSDLRLTGIGLTTADLPRLIRFYTEALGFAPVDHVTLASDVVRRVYGVAGSAERVVLTLGSTWLELLTFTHPGGPYPAQTTAIDLIFQHFAMIVDDMPEALARLQAVGGFTPISIDGPQTLPASSGGVIAFKFRDPDGHPLELLVLPKRPAVFELELPDYRARPYIDHSAFCVNDEAISRTFYRNMGFPPAERTINTETSQGRLDGVQTPAVTVQALRGEQEPHLELLCYPRAAQPPLRLDANDIAATRLLFGTAMSRHVDPDRTRLSHDPDGHALVVPIHTG